MRKTSSLLLVLMLLLGLVHVSPLPVTEAQAVTKDISFQPSMMGDVTFTYDRIEHWFELAYKQYFMRFRPFAIYNNTVYTQRQIVQFLRSRGVTYNDVILKGRNALHWGFNITGIPQDIQNNLQYVGFKLTDYNFPLNLIELREEQGNYDDGTPYTFITFAIAEIPLYYDFQDLLRLGYTVDIINKTYILVGKVDNKENLLIDPITYGAPYITVTGYSEATPCTFWDIWNASYVNGWGVVFNQQNMSEQYMFNASIVIGDGSTQTWFSDSRKQVVFMNDWGLGSWGNLIYVQRNAHLRLGLLLSAGQKRGTDGVHLISNYTGVHVDLIQGLGVSGINNASDIQLYGSTFHNDDTGTSSYLRGLGDATDPAEIYDCIADKCNINSGHSDFSYFIQSRSLLFHNSGTYSFVFGFNCSDAIGAQGSGLTFINCSLFQNTWEFRLQNMAYDSYALNCYSDDWVSRWLNFVYVYGEGRIPRLWRQYTFDLNVTDNEGIPIENAEVSIYSHNGSNLIGTYITDSSGSIGRLNLTYSYYYPRDANVSMTNYVVPYNNYLLRVEHDLYSLYRVPFVLTDRMVWKVAMITPPVTLTPIVVDTATDLTPFVLFLVCALCISLALVGLLVPFVGLLSVIMSLLVLIPIPLSSVAYILALQVGTIIFSTSMLIISVLRRNSQLDDEDTQRVPAYRRR